LGDQLQAIQLLVAADFARPVVGGAGVAADNPAAQRFNAAALAAARADSFATVALAMPDWSGARLAPLAEA
jgi:hypothetical protein